MGKQIGSNPFCTGQNEDQIYIRDSMKYYFLLIVVLLITTAIFLFALFSDKEMNLWFIKEDGLVETMSAVGYIVAALMMIIFGGLSYIKKMWYFPVVVLAFAMRELDFDKRFTEVGVLKSRFLFSPEVSVTTKIIGAAIVLFIFFTGYKIVKNHAPGLWCRFRQEKMNSIDWCAAIIVLFLVVSKSIDGLGRKLLSIGIEISERTVEIAAHLEESMEWAIPFVIIVAFLSYLSRRKQLRAVQRNLL